MPAISVAGIAFANDPPTTVTGVTFTSDPRTSGNPFLSGGSQIIWYVNFTTSEAGALRADHGDTITLTAPDGVTFPTATFRYFVNGSPANDFSAAGNAVQITVPGDIGNGEAVEVIINGVTNAPPGVYGPEMFSVVTSVDQVVAHPSSGIEFDTSVERLIMLAGHTAADLTSTWTVLFSATSGLEAGDAITITAPEGTAFPADVANYTINDIQVGEVTGGGTHSVVVTVPVGFPTVVDDGDVEIVVADTANPAAGEYDNRDFSLATSRDSAPEYLFVGTTSFSSGVRDLVFAPGSNAAGEVSTWTITFTTSPDGALEPEDTVAIFAQDARFPTEPEAYTVNGVTVVELMDVDDDIVEIALPQAIPASSEVRIEVPVQNPPPGTYESMQFGVLTAADLAAIFPQDGFTFYSAVEDVTFTLDSVIPTASSTWTVAFRLSEWGQLDEGEGTITLTGPEGTSFSDAAGDYIIDGTPAATVDATAGNSVTITVPDDLEAEQAVMVVAQNTTNPALGDYAPVGFSVATSADVAPAYPVTINSPPIADAGPDQDVKVSDTVVLDGNASHDPDGDDLTYSWTLGTQPVGSTTELVNAASASPSFIPDSAGTYVVELVVSDGKVESDPDAVTVEVEPWPVAGFTFTPDEGVTTETEVQFTDASTGAGIPLTAWSWDFGDGSSSTEQNPTHQYVDPGVYHITLQVTDANDHTSESAHAVVLVGSSEADLTGISQLTIPGYDTVDATAEAGIVVEKYGPGTPVITVAAFAANPLGEAGAVFQSPGSYFDINLDTADGVDAINITWTFGTDVETEDLVMLWFDPEVDGLRIVREQTLVLDPGGGGTLKIHLDDTTSPRIDQLTGTVFAAGQNGGPDVTLLAPESGDVWTGMQTIRWTAVDPDGDDNAVTIDIQYSADGLVWTDIGTGVANDGEHVWNTAEVASGGEYRIRLSATDELGISTDLESDPFVIAQVSGGVTHGPNPASERVTFYFGAASAGTLYVFDAAGRLVWSVSVPTGTTQRVWDLRRFDGAPLANGLYLYRLVRTDGNASEVGTLVIVR